MASGRRPGGIGTGLTGASTPLSPVRYLGEKLDDDVRRAAEAGELKGTLGEILEAEAAYKESKAAGTPSIVWRRLLFHYGRLCQRKVKLPRPSIVDQKVAKIVAKEREVLKGQAELEKAIHRGKTEWFVTDTLNFLRREILPKLTQRLNRPSCPACKFQKDHKEERWALQAGVELGDKILDIYAKSAGRSQQRDADQLVVAEWPTEAAKS